jgi:Ca2+-transporting ATPase
MFVFMELVVAIKCRSLRYSVFRIRPHRLLWLAVFGNAALTIGLFSIPFVADAFGLVPIGAFGAELIVIVCLLTFVSLDIVKRLFGRFSSPSDDRPIATL